MRLHVSLGDEAVSRADEREGDDDRELGRGAGKRDAAERGRADAREQAGEGQLPNAQSQRVDLFDEALADDDVGGVDERRKQHDERAGVEAGEVGAREQQHAPGYDGGADEHLALGGAAQQQSVGERHDHDRQALQKAGSGSRGEA